MDTFNSKFVKGTVLTRCTIFVIVLFLFTLSESFCQAVGGWVPLQLPLGSYSILSIDFANADSGMIIAPGIDGGVFRTDNGGLDWRFIPRVNYSPLRDAYLSEVKHVGANEWIIANLVGEFARSTDFGDTWTVASHCTETGTSSISRATDSTLVAVGQFGSGNYISWSFNNNENWVCDPIDDSVRPIAVAFPEPEVGFVVGTSYPSTILTGGLIKTIDGGKTWTKQSLVTSLPLTDIGFTTTKHGFITTGQSNPVYESTDEGLHWLARDDFGQRYAYSVSWDSSGHGMISCDSGYVFYSRDHGNTWQMQNIGVPITIQKVVIVDSSDAYAIAWSQDVQYVFKTTSANVTSVPQNSNSRESTFSGNRVIINTTASSIDVIISLSEPGSIVSTAVFDTRGRCVNVYVNTQLLYDRLQISIENRDLPLGLYLMAVKVGSKCFHVPFIGCN